MKNNDTSLDFPFKIGDKVRSKLNPDEYGEICCISYTTKSARVYQQHPFGKIWWYDVSEIERLLDESLH